jgi:hypothetical protein
MKLLNRQGVGTADFREKNIFLAYVRKSWTRSLDVIYVSVWIIAEIKQASKQTNKQINKANIYVNFRINLFLRTFPLCTVEEKKYALEVKNTLTTLFVVRYHRVIHSLGM